MMSFQHVTVLLNEAVTMLDCAPGKIIVDCTLGGAGHSLAIVKKIVPGGVLVGIDQDMDAIQNAGRVLGDYAGNVRLVHDNFANLPSILQRLGIHSADGILVDLGLSLHQIKDSGRGFSFAGDQPLDMRMNRDTTVTAASIVNQADSDALERIFREYGEERWAKRIARRIVEERRKEAIVTTGRLVDIIENAVPRASAAKSRIHPATRVFMALRIAVNRELEVLERFLDTAIDVLAPGGRICIISFHSLEDRMVKNRFRSLSEVCRCPKTLPVCICTHKPKLRLVSRKPIRPSGEEVASNPMSRSAVMRVAEKLPDTGSGGAPGTSG